MDIDTTPADECTGMEHVAATRGISPAPAQRSGDRPDAGTTPKEPSAATPDVQTPAEERIAGVGAEAVEQSRPVHCPVTGDPAAGGPVGGCPVAHGAGGPHGAAGQAGKVWSEAALSHVRARVAAAPMEAERAERMSRAVAEERARRRHQEITELFVRSLGKKLGYGHPLSERTGELHFTWTPEAEARLEAVPQFCRELTRWRVEWTAHKLGLGDTITEAVMDVKYEMWGAVSHAIEERRGEGLPWTDSARARFDAIPEFVRGQVLEAVEGNARTLGAPKIDDLVIDRVIERWIATGDFHEGLYGFR
ncbi:MAG: PCP reductase family protein [Candidatus Dormibacteria bacterium]